MLRRLAPIMLLGFLLSPWASGKPIPMFTPLNPEAPTPTPTPTETPDPPPTGFEMREQFGKVCRIARLPWEIYSADPRYREALAHAVNSWNEAGRRLGMGLIYEISPTPEGADLIVDWSGLGLDPQRASAVWWDAGLGHVDVTGLTMDGRMNLPLGNFAQLLMHEMGHPLGLGHSADPNDIMFITMHRRRYNRVTDARLTNRDLEALAWLYRQKVFVPVRGRRSR